MNRTGNCFQSNNVTHLVSIDNEHRNTHTLETVVALPVMNPTVLLLVPIPLYSVSIWAAGMYASHTAYGTPDAI